LVRGIRTKSCDTSPGAFVYFFNSNTIAARVLDEDNLKFSFRQVESNFSYFNFQLIIYHNRLPTHYLFPLHQINLLDLRLGHGNTGYTSGMWCWAVH